MHTNDNKAPAADLAEQASKADGKPAHTDDGGPQAEAEAEAEPRVVTDDDLPKVQSEQSL